MPCCAPLLSLSHCFSLFLKNLLSSSPQSSGSECPRRGAGAIYWFLTFHTPESCSAHMVWFCVGAAHMHRGSTPNLWTNRNRTYLFIPEGSYSPFILTPTASSRSALRPEVGCELRSLCLPWRARRAKSWWQLSRAWGRSQMEGGSTPAAEILTNSGCCLLKTPSSSLLYPGRDLLPWCSVTVPRQETGTFQCLTYSSDI